MGEASDAMVEFVESIPDEKLINSDPSPSYTIYKTHDFRLDIKNGYQPKKNTYNV